jgi:hypothetical protein
MPAGQFIASDASIWETQWFRPDAAIYAVPGRRRGPDAASAGDGRRGTVPSLPETVSVDLARLVALPGGDSPILDARPPHVDRSLRPGHREVPRARSSCETTGSAAASFNFPSNGLALQTFASGVYDSEPRT